MKDLDRISTEHFQIPSDTPGINLHVLNKRDLNIKSFSAERTILMMHGATFSSGSLYDVAHDGYSFVDYLALQGFDVYALDVRGYGESSRPAEMDRPPQENAPLVRTETGVRDLGSAVDFILRTRGLKKLNVIGMSWGGSVTGAYVSRHNDKVVKLGLIAPQWLSTGPVPIDNGGQLDAYRIVPVSAIKERWLSCAPAHSRDGLIPKGWFEAWVAATVKTEPLETLREKNAIRATNGAILDIREYWTAGKPFYDPSQIEVPVLLTHGEWDRDVPLDLAQAYFSTLNGAPYRRWLEVGEATHMMVLEKNRLQVFNALARFFEEDFVPAA
jgi:pimeloyl-ACP methyl ester carboxylesterase